MEEKESWQRATAILNHQGFLSATSHPAPKMHVRVWEHSHIVLGNDGKALALRLHNEDSSPAK